MELCDIIVFVQSRAIVTDTAIVHHTRTYQYTCVYSALYLPVMISVRRAVIALNFMEKFKIPRKVREDDIV